MAEPMNPLAGKAGPGKFSVREDLPPSKEYGERKQMEEIIGGAATSPSGSAAQKISTAPMEPVTSLFAPSQRPDEPVTAGIAMGDGPGPEALVGRSMYAQDSLSKILSQMLPYDTNGEIAALYEQAVSRGL
jgi:hypothetical protein